MFHNGNNLTILSDSLQLREWIWKFCNNLSKFPRPTLLINILNKGKKFGN